MLFNRLDPARQAPVHLAILAAALLCALSWACRVDAETRVIEGMGFEIDELTPVDGSNVRVSVFGRERVVPAEQADREIVAEHFTRPQAIEQFSIRSLENFTTAALDHSRPELAALGLRAIVEHPEVDRERLTVFVDELAARPRAPESFKAALEPDIRQRIPVTARVRMLFWTARTDLGWVRANTMSQVLSDLREFRQLLRERFGMAIRSRDDDEVGIIVKIVFELLGSEDSLYRDIRVLEDKLRRFKEAVDRDDVEVLEVMIEGVKREPSFREELSRRYVEAIHAQVRALIGGLQTVKALNILSTIDVSLRTPTTHELLQSIVSEMTTDNASVLLRQRQRRFLTMMAQFDPAVEQAVGNFFDRAVRDALARGDDTLAEQLFEALLLVREDPSEANDALRIEQIVNFMRHGKENIARSKFSEIQSRLSLGQYRALLGAGMYGRWSTVLMVALLPFAGFIILMLARRRSQQRPPPNAPVESEAEEEYGGSGYGRSHFKVLRAQKVINPYLDEYSKCLEVFALPVTASLKEIKVAYRHAVKVSHPDRQRPGQSGGEEVSDRFIELTQKYQRILELRRSLGLPDDE